MTCGVWYIQRRSFQTHSQPLTVNMILKPLKWFRKSQEDRSIDGSFYCNTANIANNMQTAEMSLQFFAIESSKH